ncbi:MAG: hypothetical protein LBI06_04725 [Treponema sp.]|jgi:hypothetical protein|nr:hypothetical protein [Treponema sp.]
MKYWASVLTLILTLTIFSCGGLEEDHRYLKSFFIDETSFDIEGEVFVNDSLTEKANFGRIAVKVDSVNGWEIEGIKREENKFTLTVNTSANGITLSKDTIAVDKEGSYFFTYFPDGFPYCTLVFHVDTRTAYGAIEPEFSSDCYYVYISEAIDISSYRVIESSRVFGGIYRYHYHHDLNFPQPGWYKVLQSDDKPIGNKEAYSSGSNTLIRTPK